MCIHTYIETCIHTWDFTRPISCSPPPPTTPPPPLDQTDPQMHSRGMQFGDGDLGAKGMALFFKTHECNDLCKHLKIPPFEMKGRKVEGGGGVNPLCDDAAEYTGPVNYELAKIALSEQVSNPEAVDYESAMFHLHKVRWLIEI